MYTTKDHVKLHYIEIDDVHNVVKSLNTRVRVRPQH